MLTWSSDPTGQSYNMGVGTHDSFDGVDHVRLVHKVEKVDMPIPHILEVIVSFDVDALMRCSDEVQHFLLVRSRGWESVVPPFLGLQAEYVSNKLVAVVRLQLGRKTDETVCTDEFSHFLHSIRQRLEAQRVVPTRAQEKYSAGSAQ